MAQLNFNAAEVEPQTSFDPIPAGWYKAMITESEFKTTRNGEYQMNWKLSLSSASTHRYRLEYTAVFDPKTNRIKMRARFLSMDTSNRPKGQ